MPYIMNVSVCSTTKVTTMNSLPLGHKKDGDHYLFNEYSDGGYHVKIKRWLECCHLSVPPISTSLTTDSVPMLKSLVDLPF